MPQEDPYAKYAVGPVSADPSATANPSAPTQGDDPYAKYAVTPVSTPTSPTPPDNPDPYAKYAIGGGSAPKPESEQDSTIGERFSKAWNEPGKGVMGHIWNVLNTPTVDIDSALGRTSQAGGFEKGANDLASGLTSPLSIALTIGTFGLGGLVEAGGMTALRAGMSATEVADVVKGAQIFSDAAKAGRSAEEGYAAVKAAGVDPDLLNKGLQTLKAASLEPDSLLSKGLVRNAASSFSRKLGLSAATAENVGKWTQFATSAGLSAQQAMTAAELSPRVLDAISDGDWETAKRLGVDALGSALIGGAALHETLAEPGGLMNDVGAKLGLHVKPSAENLILRNEAGRYAVEVAEAGRTQELWADSLRKQYPKMSPAQLERIRYWVESGENPEKMARRGHALAESGGVEPKYGVPETPIEGPLPENGQAPPTETTPVTSGLDPQRLAEVTTEQHLKNSKLYTSKELETLVDAYDPTKLTDADKALAKEIRNKFSDTADFAHQKEALADGQGVQDYVTSLYEKGGEDNPATNQLVHEANNGQFATNTSMARSRIFDNAFEGQLFGKKLAETDPITLAAHNANVFRRIVAAREMKERLLDAGTRGSDGMPILAYSGESHPVTDSEGKAVMVNPRGVRSIKIPDQIIQGIKDKGDLERMIKEGKIVNLKRSANPDNLPGIIDRLENSMIKKSPVFDEEGNSVMLKNIQILKDVRDGKLPNSVLDEFNAQLPDAYAWNPRAANYQTLDHTSMRDWKHLGQSPSGDSVMMKSDLLVHPEAAEYMKRILGIDKQGPGDSGIGKVAQKINQEAKGVLLFGSPFHIMQIGLRGIMSGVSPFRRLDKWDLANDPKLQLGVHESLTLGKSYNNRAAFSEGLVKGHSTIIDKIPGLREIQAGQNSFLFDKLIPTMKVETYRSLYNRYEKANPTWTAQRIAREAAEETNERLGGLNYKDLGRSASTQNWFKLFTLAPDWLESEIRSILRPFGANGSISRQDFARITAYMWTTARVLNMLTNQGHPHLEAPFGVVYKQDNGKTNVISMRSLPADMLHASSDPLGFIRGRMSPLVRTGNEVYSGRDSYGRKLTHGDLIVDVLHNQLPIPFQSVGKTITGTTPDIGNAGQVANAAGLTDSVYRTEAQRKAAEVASNHSEAGPVDKEQLARHQTIMNLEDQVRSGHLLLTSLQPLRISGQLPESDYKKIVQNYTKTRGMSPDMAHLYTRAVRAPASDLLSIYDLATPSEKQVLLPVLQTASAKYIRKSMKDSTPAERMNDPVLARFMKMHARLTQEPTM